MILFRSRQYQRVELKAFEFLKISRHAPLQVSTWTLAPYTLVFSRPSALIPLCRRWIQEEMAAFETRRSTDQR